MNDLDDMDFLLGAEDDDGRGRRRGRGGNGRKGRRRRRRRNRGGFLAPLLAFIILAGIIGGGGYYGYRWVSDALVPDDYTGQGTGEVTIEIQEGQSASEVAEELQRQGVVASARAFTNAIDSAGKSSSLQPGTYKLRKKMAAAEAVKLLDPDNLIVKKVTIKEGLRLSDTFKHLEEKTGIAAKEFENVAESAEDLGLPGYAKGKLEGYAFPATYDFQPDASAAEMLARMVERFNETAERIELESSAKKMGYSPHEMMTIASIIQAEAGRHEDMPKIARVIYNRLNHEPEMTLSMDSTVMYAWKRYRTRATHAELEIKSPYNTYKHLGLPPGPIANPGDHAIEAALNPAKGDWLYFAATDPKSNVTKFATTEAERKALLAELERNSGGG